MVRGVASILEKHHRVQVLDEALEAAVRLSHRYIPGAAAAGQGGQPARHGVRARRDQPARRAAAARGLPQDDRGAADRAGDHRPRGGRRRQRGRAPEGGGREARREPSTRARSWRSAGRPSASWWSASSRSAPSCGRAASRSKAPAASWSRPRKRRSAGRPTAPAAETVTPEERQTLLAELADLQAQLSALQGESPLILPSVDEQAVASVVQDWTGVPVGRMVKNEIETVLNLAETLNQRVIGQRHALDMIAKRIQTSRAKLDNPNKPIGVFMLCGPSGVGKTETALTLAEALYGGEQNVITINMSEFQEAHTVSTLKGSPPGYVGYGEGGVLTEAVRRRPYSVVLLDEVEKAHSDVHELFFQVFDKGWMEDGEGRRHRLQEHDHPADVERRHRSDHEHVQGPGADAGARRASPRRCASRC